MLWAVWGQLNFRQFLVPACNFLKVYRHPPPPQCSVSVNYRVLICCTCHLQSSSLFFVYFGFLCFQVSSESNFCSDTRGEGGQLFGFIYSVALWEGRSTANIAGVCGECSQCLDHTGFAPTHRGVCFLGLHCSGSRFPCRGTVQGRPCISCTFQV